MKIKKIIIFWVILMLILLTGCSPKYVCQNGETVEDPKECIYKQDQTDKLEELLEELETVPEEAEEVPEAKTDIDPLIQEFIDKVNTYDNYEFEYKSPDSAYVSYASVKGDMVKYHYKDIVQYLSTEEYYDTVVLDLNEKTAYQYCDDGARCSEENMNFIRKVDYMDRKIPTLKEIMNSLEEAKIVGDEMMLRRSSKKVEFSDGNIKGMMWIDKYYGIPLRREYMVADDNKIELFDEFVKGGVTDGMVKLPSHLEVR